MSSKYHSGLALKEHFIQGNRVTQLEAILLFGVQTLRRRITDYKKQGHLVKSEKVPMAKVLTRINKYIVCTPPKELPTREIVVTEYWFSE